MTTRVRALGAAVVAVLLLGGCGASERPSTPVELLPTLVGALAEVDEAMAAERYDEARRELGQLIRMTTAARDGGVLPAGDAEAIIEAAQILRSQLPRPESEDGEEGAAPPPVTVSGSSGSGEAPGRTSDEGREAEKQAAEREREAEKQAAEREREAEKLARVQLRKRTG